jgi:predicted phosphoadenosine phosphosulfate sulfurtransferase
MIVYLNDNVLEAARKRISFIFDEFENIVLTFSGGKDSTVCFWLALDEAKKRNRLPLNVMWIDQEAEWKGTVDFIKTIMTMPEVKPYWFQIPMVITNNASTLERYSYCWDEKQKDKWIHPQVDISIKENKYNTDRFHQLFKNILKIEFPGKTCTISGVRAEEAPKRKIGLTMFKTYKWVTWGNKSETKDQYNFYPLYDWSYTDIWKYIYDNNISYNKVYDEMYRRGMSISDMRISNVHHETAVQSLLQIQEIEPETWEKISRKITGANTVKHLDKYSYTHPKKLPYMFVDWEEYGIHLIDTLVNNDEYKTALYKKINSKEPKYSADFYKKNNEIYVKYWKVLINTILSADWDFTKLENFSMAPDTVAYRMYHLDKKHLWRNNKLQYKYLSSEERKICIEYFKQQYQNG